jgi:N-acetyl-anhydromuramyl-L-alanine amidase AmpD
MTITNHTLNEAIQDRLPGGSSMPVRRFLVIHFTAGASAKSSINFWKSSAAKGASAHIVIDRDGTIYQCRPFNITAGHAGKSRWKDPSGRTFEGLNSCSIGIELANAGDGANEDGTAFSSRKFICPAGVQKAKHKNGGPLTFWEKYTPEQLAAVEELSKLLVKTYNLDDVIGHEDIAPDRKNDPGPLFPMSDLRKKCGIKREL